MSLQVHQDHWQDRRVEYPGVVVAGWGRMKAKKGRIAAPFFKSQQKRR